MKRRLLLAGTIALPAAARAQARMPHIAYLGVLGPTTIDPRQIEAFKKGLAENGLIEGRTIAVDYCWAEGDQERLKELSSRLAADKRLDVIVTVGPQAVQMLLSAGARQPIVMAVIGDPVASGLATSLARPGGTVTGLSMANRELEAKRLEIIRELVPGVSRVLVIYDPSMGPGELDLARDAARVLGIEMVMGEVSDSATFDAVFGKGIAKGVTAVSITASPFINFNRARLIELANRHRLPSIWENTNYVREGGLASYGPSFPDLYRRSAAYVARILKGARVAELPFEQPNVFEFGINRRTAALLGVALSPALLARADEVIE